VTIGPQDASRGTPRTGAFLALGALTALLAGCERRNTFVPPPPNEVTVSHPERRTVTNYLEYTGTARAVETVQVRARVEGYLDRIQFKDGQEVEQGQLLFEIDPRPFRAKLDAAQAELASAQAQFARRESDFQRDTRLRQRGALSEEEYVTTRAERDAARAAVAAAQATVATAELDLGYTQVTAPIAGHITERRVDVGNLVGRGDATPLATIVRDNPIHAYWTASEADLLRVRSKIPEGQRDVRDAPMPIDLGLANEQGYPHQGQFDYADPYVDPATGTITGRGTFENPDHAIVPGMFVRIRVPLERDQDALLVPERAIGSDQAGRYVLVVNDRDVVEQRPIVPGSLVDGMRVIASNLEPDDRVVVNGLQRARPGTRVKPVMAGATAAAKADAPAPPAPAPAAKDKQQVTNNK
jgi:membrane fusion protein (multidrug efflux system)